MSSGRAYMPPIFDKDGNVIRPATFVPPNSTTVPPKFAFGMNNQGSSPQTNPFVENTPVSPFPSQTCRQDIPNLEDLLEVPGITREAAERFLNQLTKEYVSSEVQTSEAEQRNWEFR